MLFLSIMIFIIKQRMNIQTLEELIQAVDKIETYNHEIKGKRIKKEIKSLIQTHFEHITFSSFQIKDIGIYIKIAVNIQSSEPVNLILRIDSEYPFNPPQVFYADKPNSQYGYCKDLMPSILKNQVWGPSLILPNFVQKLPLLARSIYHKQRVSWTYHNFFQYNEDELKSNGVRLFAIEEYRWQYKILKFKRAKFLGITSQCLLKFEKKPDSEKVLKLQFWAPLKDVIEVQAKTSAKTFQLQIDYTKQEKTQKMYLGGDQSLLEQILDNLNPIQMIERKVANFQKSGISDYNQAIKAYTTLIQHYSLSNKELTDKYMASMKKLIETQYKEPMNGGIKIEG